MTQLAERLKQEVSFWLAQVHFPTYQVSGDLERESRPQPAITSTAEMGSQGVQIQQKPQSEVDTELVQMPEKIQQGQRQGGPPRTRSVPWGLVSPPTWRSLPIPHDRMAARHRSICQRLISHRKSVGRLPTTGLPTLSHQSGCVKGDVTKGPLPVSLLKTGSKAMAQRQLSTSAMAMTAEAAGHSVTRVL